MKISTKAVKLAQKLKKYNISIKYHDELKIKNDAISKQNKKLKSNLKLLKSNTLDQNRLLAQIKDLEKEKKVLLLELDKSKKDYDFLVTTPKATSSTVYGAIKLALRDSKNEILICSPWITYLAEELSGFNKSDKKRMKIKVITRLIKEDIEKGITDLDKLRALKEDLGAEVRYNNDLHAKMVVVDRSRAIISSANLTKKGLAVNYEAGVILKNSRAIGRVAEFFKDIWDDSLPLTDKAIKKVQSDN